MRRTRSVRQFARGGFFGIYTSGMYSGTHIALRAMFTNHPSFEIVKYETISERFIAS